MKRLAIMFAALAAMLTFATAAQAQFGFKDLAVTFEEKEGSSATQAGAHPFEMTTEMENRNRGGLRRHSRPVHLQQL